ncbi:MAG TPA: diguanylate cyclase [Arenimonas sp.]|uniref:diguanylate cyclase domain-containing protein n=1 Tax=Arenimonas sp. TaxID=1872635 RepID=UPI002B7557EA|nr:diguanylate cyclase [Arenimonas sp.]HMB56820.1 diguanylate cyclase [Arenimonas sp.]
MWAGCLALLVAISAAAQTPATSAPAATADTPKPALAIMETPSGTPLEDILSGRAQPGFTPILENTLGARGQPGKTIWLRLRTDLPTDGSRQWLRLDRQAIKTARLHVPGPPTAVVAETGHGQKAEPDPEWPDAFLMPVPEQLQGPTTLYVEIDGEGFLSLHPEIIAADDLESRDRPSQRLYGSLYGLLVLIALVAIFRQFQSPTSGGASVLLATVVCGIACLAANDHLDAVPLGARLASFGPKIVPALWLLACAPLLWSTSRYAGLEKNSPDLQRVLTLAGGGFLALAVVAVFVPLVDLPELQLTSIVLRALVMLACIVALAMDPRQWRWGPILVCLGVIAAMVAQFLAMKQMLPMTLMLRRGYELLIALLLALYLVLPWIRQKLQVRAQAKRAIVPELSTVEKIEKARAQLMAGLESALVNAAEGDLEWVAYRRLLEGLKPVLPQLASAVVAMNYHHEDLLLVEPKSAEPRYQVLLDRRAQLMKNLSRSRAPQQIGIDFDGPEGPLQQVRLAVIPLPIAKPGWGALLIERKSDVLYSEDELDLCAEFAALATTAGDEAAAAMLQRHAEEIDSESGVYKRAMIDQHLQRMHELAFLQHKPLAVMRVGLDQFEAVPKDVIASVVNSVADLIREEVDYGDVVGRFAADEFLVLMPGRKLGLARELGDRICAAVAKMALPAGSGIEKLTATIGISAAQPGERGSQLMMERVAQAVGKARQYGGNQTQAISSVTV